MKETLGSGSEEEEVIITLPERRSQWEKVSWGVGLLAQSCCFYVEGLREGAYTIITEARSIY